VQGTAQGSASTWASKIGSSCRTSPLYDTKEPLPDDSGGHSELRCFEDEADSSMTPPTSRTWAGPGHTPVIRVRRRSQRRISIAAPACYKQDERARLIYRRKRHVDHKRGGRRSFTWTDYRDLLTAAHQQLGRPIGLIRDNLLAAATASDTSREPLDESGKGSVKPALGLRWVRLVVRKPVLFLVAASAALVVLALPAADIRLGLPDDGTEPTETTQRKAYDLVSEGFGPGHNGPLTIVVDAKGGGDPRTAAEQVSRSVTSLPDVEAVSPPVANGADDTAVMMVTPKSSPASVATEDLVSDIRDGAEDVRRDTGAAIAVTGTTALNSSAAGRPNPRTVCRLQSAPSCSQAIFPWNSASDREPVSALRSLAATSAGRYTSRPIARATCWRPASCRSSCRRLCSSWSVDRELEGGGCLEDGVQACDTSLQLVGVDMAGCGAHGHDVVRVLGGQREGVLQWLSAFWSEVRVERAVKTFLFGCVDVQQANSVAKFGKMPLCGSDYDQRSVRPKNTTEFGAVAGSEDVEHHVDGSGPGGEGLPDVARCCARVGMGSCCPSEGVCGGVQSEADRAGECVQNCGQVVAGAGARVQDFAVWPASLGCEVGQGAGQWCVVPGLEKRGAGLDHGCGVGAQGAPVPGQEIDVSVAGDVEGVLVHASQGASGGFEAVAAHWAEQDVEKFAPWIRVLVSRFWHGCSSAAGQLRVRRWTIGVVGVRWQAATTLRPRRGQRAHPVFAHHDVEPGARVWWSGLDESSSRQRVRQTQPRLGTARGPAVTPLCLPPL
jgi:hypothetical protein